MNLGETIIKENGNESEPNEKSVDKGIWKSIERERERRADAIGRIHKVPNAKNGLVGNPRNFLIIKEIGNGSEPNEQSIDKGIWKSVERETKRPADAIGGIHKVPNAKKSIDEKTATP